jgi:hypothetical protein
MAWVEAGAAANAAPSTSTVLANGVVFFMVVSLERMMGRIEADGILAARHLTLPTADDAPTPRA